MTFLCWLLSHKWTPWVGEVVTYTYDIPNHKAYIPIRQELRFCMRCSAKESRFQ